MTIFIPILLKISVFHSFAQFWGFPFFNTPPPPPIFFLSSSFSQTRAFQISWFHPKTKFLFNIYPFICFLSPFFWGVGRWGVGKRGNPKITQFSTTSWTLFIFKAFFFLFSALISFIFLPFFPYFSLFFLFPPILLHFFSSPPILSIAFPQFFLFIPYFPLSSPHSHISILVSLWG